LGFQFGKQSKRRYLYWSKNSQTCNRRYSNWTSRNVQKFIYIEHKPVIEGKMSNKQKSDINSNSEKGNNRGCWSIINNDFKINKVRATLWVTKERTERESRIKKTEKLECINHELEIMKSICGQDQMKTIKELKDSNLRLEKENNEMKDFLRDYGLIWVGKDGQANKNFDINAVKENLNQKGSLFRNNLPSEIDLEVIAKRIEELNFVAGFFNRKGCSSSS